MQPAESRPNRAAEADLDEVIDQIDQALPRIHRLCRLQKKQKKSPTARISDTAHQRMKALSDDPVVIDNGSDGNQEDVLEGVNGARTKQSEKS